MEGEDERSEDSRSFSSASIPKRIAIVSAGAIVNILFAIVIYFILMATNSTYITNEVSSTINQYTAQEAGVQQGDKIIEINGHKIANKIDLDKIFNGEKPDEVKIVIDRNGEILRYILNPTQREERYYLGIEFKPSEDTILNHLINGWNETGDFVFSVADNIKMLFTGNVGIDQMVGPVGISEVVSKTNGIKEFIYMLALISISLGVTNLLPIPALDGGKILILIIEAIRRKPMKQELEVNIQLLGFAILIGLSLFVTYNDIVRIF